MVILGKIRIRSISFAQHNMDTIINGIMAVKARELIIGNVLFCDIISPTCFMIFLLVKIENNSFNSDNAIAITNTKIRKLLCFVATALYKRTL